MKQLILLSFLLFNVLSAYCQDKILFGGGMDVFRTDDTNAFKKAQIGMEINYFVVKKLSLSGGMEVWEKPNTTFISAGVRVYPSKPFFLRIRALFRKNVDWAIGSGYDIHIAKRIWIELLSDYYSEEKTFAIRAGLVFGF